MNHDKIKKMGWTLEIKFQNLQLIFNMKRHLVDLVQSKESSKDIQSVNFSILTVINFKLNYFHRIH